MARARRTTSDLPKADIADMRGVRQFKGGVSKRGGE